MQYGACVSLEQLARADERKEAALVLEEQTNKVLGELCGRKRLASLAQVSRKADVCG